MRFKLLNVKLISEIFVWSFHKIAESMDQKNPKIDK